MSFGYLIITSHPCPVLTQTRGETFSLIMKNSDYYVYFRFCESHFYTERNDEIEVIFTDIGMNFFKRIYKINQGKFVFADVLLQKNEGEVDFAKVVLKQLKNKEVPIIKAKKNLKIKLCQPYFIEI